MPVHRVRAEVMSEEMERLERSGETVLHTHYDEDRKLVFIYTEITDETR